MSEINAAGIPEEHAAVIRVVARTAPINNLDFSNQNRRLSPDVPVAPLLRLCHGIALLVYTQFSTQQSAKTKAYAYLSFIAIQVTAYYIHA